MEGALGLLRFATARGVDCAAWFAPDGGWAGERRVSSDTFKAKMTHLGLGLAVGR